MAFIKHAAIVLLLAALIGASVAGWIILGGRFDVAVSAQLPQPVHDLIHLTRVNAVRREVRDLDARPIDLDDEAVLLGAVRGFESMCADCHQRPGGDPPALARSLNPAPAKLCEAAEKRSVEELFWVTKHGIRMSAMPAWGTTRDDQELWAIATLVARFPNLTAAEYEQMRAAAMAQ
ncbi:c-type cytochrome [Wenzhouxiangella limi]|uniref:Cytochrome c n=1 Tax=Wenzhouxiangella limi TaxID=2707351 RepID=A0A845UWI9_9GAMM|nr:cytochrome c [Wenzhouxiangella limi]NDY94622.1 cytochrome c [Wenzhouxiangella limi]